MASCVSQSGNDALLIGTHDANLIFRRFRGGGLTIKERRALISSAIESYDSSTIPIWCWVWDDSIGHKREIPLHSVVGSERSRKNAFKLLETLNISPSNFEGPVEPAKYFDFWLSDSSPDAIITAALEYIGTVGDDGFNIDWDKFLANSEANIARAAIRSKVRITARTSVSSAIKYVADRQDADLGDELAGELLQNIAAIETKLLRACLGNRTVGFVRLIAKELGSRSALTKNDAELLCESSDARTRLLGVEALREHRDLSLSDAHKIVVRPQKRNSLNWLGNGQQRDYEGERAFDQFKISVLSEKSFEELSELRSEETIFDSTATLATYSGHFKKSRPQLESYLHDGFLEYCTEKRQSLEQTPTEFDSSLFDFVRANLLQSAFEIYCTKVDKTGLKFVRDVLDKYDIKYSCEIARYLEKNGTWEDARRIATLSGKQKYRGLGLSSIFSTDHSDEHVSAANSILKLGAKRIADVLGLEVPAPVRLRILIAMPSNKFASFENSNILEMLKIETDSVREATALKAVSCLSKSRLKSLLDEYYEVDGTYYYNAVFWLDLGISVDRRTATSVARKRLAEM